MIEILKRDQELLLHYEYSDSPYWIEDKISSSESFFINRVFRVNRGILVERNVNDYQEPEYYFKIGDLIGDFFKIDRSVFSLNHNIFFHKDLKIQNKHFIVKSKISLLKNIDNNLSQDLFIGGEAEDTLPFKSFNRLIDTFPSTHEIKLYRQAKVTSILREHFDHIPDKEIAYHRHINRKSPSSKSKLLKTFKQQEIYKYVTLLEKLKTMLDDEIVYSETKWQEEILGIIRLLFPKYISVFKEVKFKDIYNKTRRLDFALIDFMGNLDLIEIKIPFDKSLVSVTPYRDNHIPNRDLSGTIMQIEKYIYYLNKSGQNGENQLTKKYKDKLPADLAIKITNPNAMIIMGRDNNLNKRQLEDFEIIKRKYKNIIDIFTYDDLIRRMNIIVDQLKLV